MASGKLHRQSSVPERSRNAMVNDAVLPTTVSRNGQSTETVSGCVCVVYTNEQMNAWWSAAV